MAVNRRTLLKVGGALVVGATPLSLLFRRNGHAEQVSTLQKDPAGLLDLPKGFSYRVIDRVGQLMSDGLRVPGRPDGMACFPGPNKTWVLMRNHELDRSASTAAYATSPPEAYDPRAFGGVTRVVIDSERLTRLSSNLVLSGTLRNCAGGASPWGWLSCEEATDSGHGYVFRCRTEATKVAPAERIVSYGRFRHEAVCIDPKTRVAYLTEDQPDSCMYRFAPVEPSKPWEGKLQAMRVRAAKGFETGSQMKLETRLEIDWVDIADPNPRADSVREQAQEQGAAIIRRGEGIWWHEGAAYVCSTNGGAEDSGQIFKLTPSSDGQFDAFEMLAESPGSGVLDMPDNITVAPWGDVYMAEDGSGEQYIRVLTVAGKFIDLARNATDTSELAGVCFAPGGNVLFVNIYSGMTFAITGPFKNLQAT